LKNQSAVSVIVQTTELFATHCTLHLPALQKQAETFEIEAAKQS
jgi:hypothetical protein